MPTKPGWKTSEFWKALFTNIAGLLVIFGVLEEHSAEGIVEAATVIAGAIISAASIIGYSLSRGSVKAGGG